METHGAPDLGPILDRCRAHDIPCPMDLLTVERPSAATLAWIEYVHTLPAPPAPEPVTEEPLDFDIDVVTAPVVVRPRRPAPRPSQTWVWLTLTGAIVALVCAVALALRRPTEAPTAPIAAPAPAAQSDIAAAFGLLARHKPDRAAAIFRALLQHDPQRADAHYGLARVYWEQGREEDALAEAQAAVRQRENDPDTWLMVASAAHRSGHLTLARQAYARTLALAPHHPRSEDIRAALRELDGR